MASPEAAVIRAWVEYAPWARVAVNGDEVVAHLGGQRHRWAIASWPQVRSTQLTPEQVLVAANLGSRLRSQMARRGQSFGDRHTLHLVAADGVLHLAHVDQTDNEPDKPQRAIPPLPPGGVRAVMTILADAEKPWTVRRLHEDAGLSVGHAQRILSTLEQADLVTSVGSGPTSHRRVREPGALLDWLAEQPAARPRPLQWATHVYGRNGREILDRAVQGLETAHCDYAVTGMAAATLSELGPTEFTRVHVWIDPNQDLATVAQRAGMKRTPRGANVVLWSDADGSGRKGSVDIDGLAVSAPVRVYLDLLSLPRGSEVATTYRRVMLGY
ncbi:helix-turn-helix domain-containing protein [Labedaea rhizosphaerae]|uniref:IclR-like helix-turn-helix domain-containing protein n=1 Tax=Labedaea rhizosphaerae TaxID=598644 RepID=A0A4R6SM85_LABRH|nr:helix-turn-helix domain-containing protein [Labedaea rhizosphaerae]TDQ04991.1 IclR-like helix-turn-helix domain-containing protein [Labedaea rhizosphaerae]